MNIVGFLKIIESYGIVKRHGQTSVVWRYLNAFIFSKHILLSIDILENTFILCQNQVKLSKMIFVENNMGVITE